QSIADQCAEKRTFACQQILLSQKWPIPSHPNVRIPLESTAAQRIWVFQQPLTKNIFDGDVLIIDISGDGEENVLSNTAVAAARDSASAKGIVINGLPIGGAFVEDFYKNYLITSNGTLFPANSFADFDDAVKKKIEFEATGGGQLPPQPTSSVPGPLPVLGIAAAFGSVRRMKKFSHHLKTYSMG
ncbi:MAG: DUF1194 domain-containing protein, partial [Cyanobacteriota bacterium]|nr:DUF1194 domain-containing protein [Cyanobacteriota bacterium]